MDLAHTPIRPEVFGMDSAEHLSASRFTIDLLRGEPNEAQQGVASQVDGEEWVRASRFVIEVDARRLPLLMPADFVPPWR